jgi:hypothetical protein
MTNDEIKDTLDFILQHQAKLTKQIEILTINVDKLVDENRTIIKNQQSLEKRTSKLEEAFIIQVELAQNVEQRLDSLNNQNSELAKLQNKNDEQISKNSEQIAELIKSQHSTSETVNILVRVLDDFINKGRNG